MLCQQWNIKINKDKIRLFYFSHSLRLPKAHRILNRQNIPFVSHVKYLGIIFNKQITWRLNTEMIDKGFRTFIRIYSLLKNEHLSANITLTLHKALMTSVMTYACSTCELAADNYLLKLQGL
jgi:hypothetical protein